MNGIETIAGTEVFNHLFVIQWKRIVATSPGDYMKRVFLFSCILLILTGCSLEEPQTVTTTSPTTPTPDVPTIAVTQSSPTATSPSTLSPLPSPAPTGTGLPTRTPTNTSIPPPLNAADGLIYENNFEYRIIEGENTRRFLPCERPSLPIFTSVYPAPNFQMFSVEAGQLMIGDRCSTETEPLINLPNRNVRRIWGQVNDWLLVESGEPGISGQGTWPLTAVRLDGSEYQLLTEEIYFGTPIISPDGYVLIPTDEQVLRWDGQSMTDTQYPLFRSGSFSPDGRLIALTQSSNMGVYDINEQLLHHVEFDRPTLPPVWHPSGEWVAVEGWDSSAEVPFTVYLLTVETGEIRLINPDSNPQFSPNGRWLVTYHPNENTQSTIYDLITWQSYEIPLNGWPVAWIVPEETSIGPRYTDELLNFSIDLPASWTAVHVNGTTTIRNKDGDPQLRVRAYLSRAGILSAETIAKHSALPAARDSLTFMETTIASYQGMKTNTAVTYINVGGRYLAFEMLGDDPIIPLLLETLQAEPTDFEDNYILLSSQNWLAELSGGANVTETLTVQRRDGAAGYMLFTEPPTPGLGYTIAEPLFFTPDERFLFFHHRGVPDGCGIYSGGGDLVQVDLSDGTQTTLEITAGVGHTLSPDGQKIAFLRGRLTNEFTLYLYDLNNGRTKTVSFSLAGANAAAGSLIFSPDGSQVAFAAQQAYCGEGWTIGIIDVATAVLTTYPADDLAFWQPVDWVNDAIVLQPFNGEATKFLNPSTGEFLNERP